MQNIEESCNLWSLRYYINIMCHIYVLPSVSCLSKSYVASLNFMNFETAMTYFFGFGQVTKENILKKELKYSKSNLTNPLDIYLKSPPI